MIVKEFITKVADGTFTKNDIIEYANKKEDKLDLVWSLWFADKAVIESTGKPQINDNIQMNRIHDAISLISQKYNISLFDLSSSNDTLTLSGSLSEDSILSKDQFNALKADFINNMDYNTLIHVLKYKKLPAREAKGEWKSKAVEAYRFANRFNIKCSEFNKCFYFPKAGKQLRCNDKPGADQPDTGAIDNVFDTKKATR